MTGRPVGPADEEAEEMLIHRDAEERSADVRAELRGDRIPMRTLPSRAKAHRRGRLSATAKHTADDTREDGRTVVFNFTLRKISPSLNYATRRYIDERKSSAQYSPLAQYALPSLSTRRTRTPRQAKG